MTTITKTERQDFFSDAPRIASTARTSLELNRTHVNVCAVSKQVNDLIRMGSDRQCKYTLEAGLGSIRTHSRRANKGDEELQMVSC